jgi:AcrR family transcriptional regulator
MSAARGTRAGGRETGLLRTGQDRSQHRRQTRAAVVEAALRLFLERGHLAVRVDDIVEAVGISRATFYKYFAERDEILAELFERLLSAPDVAIPDGSTAVERIRSLLVSTASRMVAAEDLARFVYSVPLRHDALLPGRTGEPAVMRAVRELVDEGVAAGELRSDVPPDVIGQQLARGFEAAMRDWATRRVDDAPARVRLLLDVAVDGVRSRKESAIAPGAGS